MSSYAVAILRDVNFGPEIVEYLERIDATLAPFDGHFIVHGAEPTMYEGELGGHLVVVEFPDRSHAEEWYDSAAYQEILPLRVENSSSTAFIVEGVDRDHQATDILVASTSPHTSVG
jgi:uncharacterized protein (DUF1330 family)